MLYTFYISHIYRYVFSFLSWNRVPFMRAGSAPFMFLSWSKICLIYVIQSFLNIARNVSSPDETVFQDVVVICRCCLVRSHLCLFSPGLLFFVVGIFILLIGQLVRLVGRNHCSAGIFDLFDCKRRLFNKQKRRLSACYG